jgi:hypothetical protein
MAAALLLSLVEETAPMEAPEMLSVLGVVLAAQAGVEAQVEPEAAVRAEVVSGAAIIVPARAA